MKKLLALALVLCAMLCAAALADGEFTLKDGSIQSIPEGMTDVVIPTEVNGEAVTAVSGYAMANNTEITSITVPEGVTLLENAAIYYNPALTSLTLPDSLQVISTYNVYSCDALTEVTVPANVQFIGGISFFSCMNLQTINFLGKPPVIADMAFVSLYDCTAYVPDEYVDEYRKILPEDIDVQPSGKASASADWTFPAEDLDFDAATGTVTGYHGTAVGGVVPAEIDGVQVTAIGSYAFAGLSCPVRYIRLPEGVTAINDYAFDHSMLYAISFPDTLKTIGEYAFNWATDCVPFWAENNGVEVIGAHAFDTAELPGIFYIPEGVREIGDYGLRNGNFAEVYFPASVEKVGEGAFERSKYMAYMAFASGDLPEFGANVFDCQNNLKDIDIAWDATLAQLDTAKTVFGDMGMEFCTVWRNNPSAAGVAANAPGVYEGSLLVSGPEDMPNVTVYSHFDEVEITGVGEGAFENNQVIESFYPHHCGWFTTIGDRSFQNSSLKYIELFDSVTTIGNDAFMGTKLTEITIPASVTSIGEGAFAWCEELTDVYVQCDPALFADDAFSCAPNVTLHVSDDVSPKACKALAERLEVNVTRPGGIPEDIACPYPATNPEDFSIDDTFNRLDHYNGWELNLVLPMSRDGVELTMLSNNTLSCAREEYGEPVRLPVRSVVVPESYTDIVYAAFNDLPDLEVAVIYAPLEMAFNTMFANCPKLTTVVFVNGVDKAVGYAFRNCPALETVYLGTDAEIDPNAFFECGSFTVDSVASGLPDVDAILASVKSEPMTPPETETIEMPEAEPITDANADAYLGTWSLKLMKMGDMEFNPADLGLVMNFVFTADGLVAMKQNNDIEYTVWRMEDGKAYVFANGEDFSPVVVNDDGTITIADGDTAMILIRGEASAFSAEIPAEAIDFVGHWVNDTLGMTADIYEDGTAAMTSGGESAPTSWFVSDGQAYMALDVGFNVPMVLTESGMELRADNMTIPFTRGEAAPAADVDTSAFMGYWVNDTLGMTADIYEDGTAVMTSAGQTAPTTWFVENGQVYMALDVGFNVPMVLTEAGMELRADNMTIPFTRGEAAPAADVDTSAFMGYWVNDTLGMTADIYEDGTAVMTSAGQTAPTTWFVENGQVYMALDVGFNVPMVLTEAGMELRADNMTIPFTRGEAAPVAAAPETDDENPFAGNWNCIWMMAGPIGTDPVASYGGDWSFIINADGSAKLNAGAPAEAVLEQDEYGFTRFDGMAIIIRKDGRLQYGSEMSGGMIFSKVPGDKWDPENDSFENPGETVAAEVSQQGAEVTVQTQGTSANAPAALADRIGLKFVVVNATTSGLTMDASMLGGEYSIIFKQGGDAEFTMAGVAVPGLKWTADDSAFHMTYYDGTDFVFVATPEGFDLDFYGAMVYHFVVAA